MKITILIILVYSFFIKSFALAETEDVHKSDLNYALASYITVQFDDFENSGDALVSRQEYEKCLIVLKKYIESGEYPDVIDCAGYMIHELSYPSELYANWNGIEKEEIIKNLDLFWDFDTIDNNDDDYIEINEFYDHLMNDTPHTFFDLFQEGTSYETLIHKLNLPSLEKALEYEWRWNTLNFNQSDDFMNDIIDSPFLTSWYDEYDLNFNSSVDFNEFKLVTYIKSYLLFIMEETQNETFEKYEEIWKNNYFELLSQTELKPKKNKRSVSSCSSNDVIDYSDFLCSEKRGKWYSCGSTGSYVISGTSKICLATCYYYDEDLGKYGKGADYFLTGVLGYLNEFQNCSSMSYDHPLSEDNVIELGLW